MDTTNLQAKKTAPFSISNLLRTFRQASTEETSANDHAQVSASDLSTPFLKTPEEEAQLLASLRQSAQTAGNHVVANAHSFCLLAAIRARKGDLSRAEALASNYLSWRRVMGEQHLSLAHSDKMQRQLASMMVFVSGHCDNTGRPIFNLRPRNHDPSQFSPLDTIRMVTFVLEWTLRTYPASQTHGIVFMNDMSGATFKNLDVRMPGVVQKAFSKNLPVRLAALNVMNPPGFLKVIIGIVTAVMGDKLKARIQVFQKGDENRLWELFEKDQVMKDIDIGGCAVWTEDDHKAWMKRMMDDCQEWNPVVSET